LTTGGANERNVKLGQRGQEEVTSHDVLVKFWDPPYLGNGWH